MESGKTIMELEHGDEKIINHMIGILPVTKDWVFYMGNGMHCKVKDVAYNTSENILYVYLKPISDEGINSIH